MAYEWDLKLKAKYDSCGIHVQLVRIDGTVARCDECGKFICRKCGLCIQDRIYLNIDSIDCQEAEL